MDIKQSLLAARHKTISDRSVSSSMALRPGDLLSASVLEVQKGNDALLTFGLFKAYARLPLSVVSGQDIQIRVASDGAKLRMLMVPQRHLPAMAVSDQRLLIHRFEPVTDPPKLSMHLRSLIPGETLQGRITAFEKDGLRLVDFGKFNAFVKIDIPVRQNQVLALTVVQTDGGIAFMTGNAANNSMDAVRQESPGSPLNPNRAGSAPIPGLSLPLLAGEMAGLRDSIEHLLGPGMVQDGSVLMTLSPPVKAALVNLHAFLSPASPEGDLALLISRLRDFIENSGIYFEKRLERMIASFQARPTPMTLTELAEQPAIHDLMVKDLKPNLLLLKQFLDSQAVYWQRCGERHWFETLQRVVQGALAHIARQQVLATEKPVDPDLFQAFSHLMILTGGANNARLKVYYAKKGSRDARKDPRVSILLDLDRLGAVRTDLWMVGRDLKVTFFVQDSKIKAAIGSKLHRIIDRLEITFNTVAVSVLVNQNKIIEFDGEDLTIPNRRQVDVNA